MSIVVICAGITAAQNPPGIAQTGEAGKVNLPNGSQAADFSKTGSGSAVSGAANATWHVILTSTSGIASVSGTFTPLVSNDGINWTGGGIASIALSAANAPVQGTVSTANNWAYYSGYWSALAGTNPVGKAIVNA